MSDYGIVILNYHSSQECIRIIKDIRNSNLITPIIIVDNSISNSESEALKHALLDYCHVEIVINSLNSGYYKGNLLGLKKLKKNKNQTLL